MSLPRGSAGHLRSWWHWLSNGVTTLVALFASCNSCCGRAVPTSEWVTRGLLQDSAAPHSFWWGSCLWRLSPPHRQTWPQRPWWRCTHCKHLWYDRITLKCQVFWWIIFSRLPPNNQREICQSVNHYKHGNEVIVASVSNVDQSRTGTQRQCDARMVCRAYAMAKVLHEVVDANSVFGFFLAALRKWRVLPSILSLSHFKPVLFDHSSQSYSLNNHTWFFGFLRFHQLIITLLGSALLWFPLSDLRFWIVLCHTFSNFFSGRVGFSALPVSFRFLASARDLLFLLGAHPMPLSKWDPRCFDLLFPAYFRVSNSSRWHISFQMWANELNMNAYRHAINYCWIQQHSWWFFMERLYSYNPPSSHNCCLQVAYSRYVIALDEDFANEELTSEKLWIYSTRLHMCDPARVSCSSLLSLTVSQVDLHHRKINYIYFSFPFIPLYLFQLPFTLEPNIPGRSVVSRQRLFVSIPLVNTCRTSTSSSHGTGIWQLFGGDS